VVIGILNGVGFEAVANTFAVTPFGIVFYCEFVLRIVWLWEKEWCGDEMSIARSGSQNHQADLIVRSNSTLLLRSLRFVDPFNYNHLGFW